MGVSPRSQTELSSFPVFVLFHIELNFHFVLSFCQAGGNFIWWLISTSPQTPISNSGFPAFGEAEVLGTGMRAGAYVSPAMPQMVLWLSPSPCLCPGILWLFPGHSSGPGRGGLCRTPDASFTWSSSLFGPRPGITNATPLVVPAWNPVFASGWGSPVLCKILFHTYEFFLLSWAFETPKLGWMDVVSHPFPTTCRRH